MPSLRTLVSAAAVVLAGAFVFNACSKQSEGMRCESPANGNEDCEPGLFCVQKECCSEKICCPAENPTTAECTGGAGTPPSDSGPVGETTPDTGAPAETGADAPTEAAADAADGG